MANDNYISNNDLEYFKKQLAVIYAKQESVYDRTYIDANFLRKGERTAPTAHDHVPATRTHNGFLTKEQYAKLETIEYNANNYIHPETHKASMIEEDKFHRFVTDDLIAKIESDNKCRIEEYTDEEYNELLRTGMTDPNTLYMITGLAEGKPAITAMYFNDKPYLGGYLPRYIPVERIVLDNVRFNVEAGSTTWIGASVYPSNASFRMFNYTVEDEDIVSVDRYGKMYGLKPGYTYVTITSIDNPGAYVMILVVVSDTIARKFDASPEKILLSTGSTMVLTTTFTPSNVSKDKVYWRTSDREVAIVNFNGVLTGLKAGNCKITGYTTDGSALTDTVDVVITDEVIPVESLVIEEFNSLLQFGETVAINYQVLPKNASNPNIKLTASNDLVLTVNNEDMTIVARSVGQSLLTVETTDGSNIKKVYNISVVYPPLKVESITMEPIGNKYVGNIFNISYSIFPYNADNPKVNFSINNSNIEIDDNGRCIALNEGTTTIRVSSDENPDIYVEETIELVKLNDLIKITGLELDYEVLTLNMDVLDEVKINATVYPNNASNKSIYWKSSNTDIVEIDYRGMMKLKDYGSAVVTCYTVYGDFSASCEVKVTGNSVPVSAVSLLTEPTKRILVDEKYKLPVAIYPTDAVNKNIDYKSSNEIVAIVNSEGYITGMNLGHCKIRVSSSVDSSKYDICDLTVVGSYNDILATDILIRNPVLEIKEGSQLQLDAVVLPTNTTHQELTWRSSNSSIASVSRSGVITGLSIGLCTIVATNEASGVQTTIEMSVISETGDDDLTLNNVSITPYLRKHGPYASLTQDYTFVPYSAATWAAPLDISSDFPEVVNINGETLICKNTDGFSVVRSRFTNDIYTYLQMFVTKDVELQSMEVTPNLILIEQGKTMKLRYNFVPYNFPFDYNELTYSFIEGEDCVSIENHVITALQPGFADVNVDYGYGDVECKFSIYVVEEGTVFSDSVLTVEDNVLTIHSEDYYEKYLLYAEAPRKPYLTVTDNGVTQYLKLTEDWNNSLFRFDEMYRPTSGVDYTLIPRYNFRYPDISNINFKSQYMTRDLTSKAAKEFGKISKQFKFIETTTSENVVEENAYSDTWNGLTDCYVNTKGFVSRFFMRINNSEYNNTDPKDIDVLQSITTHEFLHVLGFDDLVDADQTEVNYNTIMSYYRDIYACNKLQPSEIYTVMDMYGLEIDIFDVECGSGFKMSETQVTGAEDRLVRSFSYQEMDEKLMKVKSDVIVVGFVDKIEEMKLDIGSSTYMDYDVVTLLVSEVEKGNITEDTVQVKIPAGKLDIELGESYLMYLKTYEDVPMSPLNLGNAVQKI